MPNCNIIGCGIKRTRNQPNITLHQLPANKGKMKIWLETIGIENLKMSTKIIHVCSLHFDESCFNRTLNKVTLREDALPSRNLLPAIQTNMSGILTKNNKNPTNSQSISGCGAPNKVEAVYVPTIQNQPEEILKRTGLDLTPSTSASPELAASTSVTPDLSNKMIKKLMDKCQKQSRKIKRLNEKVRRQTKQIAYFSNIINDLKENQFRIPSFACRICRTLRLPKKASCKI